MKREREIIARVQDPNDLEYSLIAHKVQRQTLECAFVDLNKIFTEGQAYVVLSRICVIENLFILSPDERDLDNLPTL